MYLLYECNCWKQCKAFQPLDSWMVSQRAEKTFALVNLPVTAQLPIVCSHRPRFHKTSGSNLLTFRSFSLSRSCMLWTLDLFYIQSGFNTLKSPSHLAARNRQSSLASVSTGLHARGDSESLLWGLWESERSLPWPRVLRLWLWPTPAQPGL